MRRCFAVSSSWRTTRLVKRSRIILKDNQVGDQRISSRRLMRAPEREEIGIAFDIGDQIIKLLGW